MKKIIFFCAIFSCLGLTFALTDTDADGVSDEKDVCPRVYARSATGCPSLSSFRSETPLNACLEQYKKTGYTIALLEPVCVAGSCPSLLSVSGIQPCDPLFPVILDTKGQVLMRGGVYIFGFSR